MKLDDADVLLQRVGTIAIMYYDDMPKDAPRYRVDDDIDWCLDGLAVGDAAVELRSLISQTILDPTAHREALTGLVYSLVPEAADADR